jgi:hypothetical protein
VWGGDGAPPVQREVGMEPGPYGVSWRLPYASPANWDSAILSIP